MSGRVLHGKGGPFVEDDDAIRTMDAVIQEAQQREKMKADAAMKSGDQEDVLFGVENVVQPNWFAAVMTYFSYAVLICFGHIRDFFGKLTGYSRYFTKTQEKSKNKELPALLKDWENFYTRRLYHRIQDCWNRPISGAPCASAMTLVERTSDDGNCTLRLRGDTTTKINLGSYNYLGFADDWEYTCKESVMEALKRFNTSCCSAAADAGYTVLHRRLEKLVARFVGKPDAVVFSMGYGTNVSAIPALMGQDTLILSDALNHTSIVNGSRSSKAVVRVFRHNGRFLVIYFVWICGLFSFKSFLVHLSHRRSPP